MNRVRIPRRRVVLTLAQVLVAPLAACGSGANLLLDPPPAPEIVQQPSSVTVLEGQPAAFEVVVGSVAINEVTVQWQRFDPAASAWRDLPGETGFTLTLAGTTRADDGARFRVIVREVRGTTEVTSAEAVLTVTSNAPITFREENFALDADWTLAPRAINPGGTVAALAQAQGGNPGAYGHILLTVHDAAPGTAASIYALLIKTSAVYDPRALGAITAIDYAQDTVLLAGGGAGQATALIVQQDGDVYFAAPETTPERVWTRKSHRGLRAADFAFLAADLATDPARKPDFSASGAPLAFGFLRGNSVGPNGVGYATEAGLDNWTVTIYR
jgi:hypothetical protein